MYISFSICISIILHTVSSASILFVVTPHDDKRLLPQLYRKLTSKDHHVHVLTRNPLTSSKLPELLYQYDLSDLDENNGLSVASKFHLSKEADIFTALIEYNDVVKTLLNHTESVLNHRETQRLFRENEKFDACVVNWEYPMMSVLSAYFNCSLIGVSSVRPTIPALDSLGNPSHPIASPDYIEWLSVPNGLTFCERILSAFWSAYVRLYHHWVVLPREEIIWKNYLRSSLPSVLETDKLISILLLTNSPALLLPKLPTVIDLGLVEDKITLEETDPDLIEFLNTSPSGVVYLNLGDGVKIGDLSPRVEETLRLVFMHMPYDWIWVYKGDDFDIEQVNVRVISSVPEAALHHPAIKIFMINGGFQSLELAKSARKPIIGVPFGSEQSFNIKAAVDSGLGFLLDVEKFMYPELASFIIELVKNSSYTKKAEELAEDVPIYELRNIVERASWWIEHVIRTNGARHLRSVAMDIPCWKYLMLDAIGFILFSAVSLLFIVIVSIKLLVKCCAKIISYIGALWNRSNKKISVNKVKKTTQKKKKKE